ncbi:MAG: hypothetical protein JSW28_04140 [Thermoplasmata archaeon]|nr:MAG: hypothetical protein JSW28_04140 [Thermoplasmata archaeon]
MKNAVLALVILFLFALLMIAFGFLISDSGGSLVGLCIILGMLIKAMDQLIDVEGFRRFRPLILPFGVAIPLIIGYLAYVHDPVFGMVIGTALGLILSGKMDHPGFGVSIIGFIGIIVLLVLLGGLKIAATSIYIIPFAFIGCYADEIGHEKMSMRKGPRVLNLFFEHRFALKVAAVICTLLGYAELIHLVAFLCFDIAYDITARCMVCKSCSQG